ncbi:hypothetical protein MBLNU459_g3884t1 [Dothideomycetes sp. NU459]
MAQPITIPARKGAAAHLKKGQTIEIINTHGTQVVDTWAFSVDLADSTMSPPAPQYMSMQHTRCSLSKLVPRVGDALRSNERKPMLVLLEDTTPGDHDTLISACDRWRYQELGAVGPGEYHDNCADNMVAAMKDLGVVPPPFIPSPLNLFMNVPVHADRQTVSYEEPTTSEGQYVKFRAEIDLVVVLSACPNDAVQTNKWRTVDAHYKIH